MISLAAGISSSILRQSYAGKRFKTGATADLQRIERPTFDSWLLLCAVDDGFAFCVEAGVDENLGKPCAEWQQAQVLATQPHLTVPST